MINPLTRLCESTAWSKLLVFTCSKIRDSFAEAAASTISCRDNGTYTQSMLIWVFGAANDSIFALDTFDMLLTSIVFAATNPNIYRVH